MGSQTIDLALPSAGPGCLDHPSPSGTPLSKNVGSPFNPATTDYLSTTSHISSQKNPLTSCQKPINIAGTCIKKPLIFAEPSANMQAGVLERLAASRKAIEGFEKSADFPSAAAYHFSLITLNCEHPSEVSLSWTDRCRMINRQVELLLKFKTVLDDDRSLFPPDVEKLLHEGDETEHGALSKLCSNLGLLYIRSDQRDDLEKSRQYFTRSLYHLAELKPRALDVVQQTIQDLADVCDILDDHVFADEVVNRLEDEQLGGMLQKTNRRRVMAARNWCQEQGFTTARFDTQDKTKGCSPLQFAFQARSDHAIPMAAYTLRTSPPSDLATDLLSIAADSRSYPHAHFLLSNGARTDAYDDNGRTVLHRCQWHKGALKTAKMFIDHDPQLLNQQDCYGKTPLYMAVELANKEMVDLLLESGGDVDSAEKGGKTPLYVACQPRPKGSCIGRRDLEIVQSLLQHGANPNAKASWGCTPLCSAVQHASKSFDRVEFVEALVKSEQTDPAGSLGHSVSDHVEGLAAKELRSLLKSRGRGSIASMQDIATPSGSSDGGRPAVTELSPQTTGSTTASRPLPTHKRGENAQDGDPAPAGGLERFLHRSRSRLFSGNASSQPKDSGSNSTRFTLRHPNTWSGFQSGPPTPVSKKPQRQVWKLRKWSSTNGNEVENTSSQSTPHAEGAQNLVASDTHDTSSPKLLPADRNPETTSDSVDAESFSAESASDTCTYDSTDEEECVVDVLQTLNLGTDDKGQQSRGGAQQGDTYNAAWQDQSSQQQPNGNIPGGGPPDNQKQKQGNGKGGGRGPVPAKAKKAGELPDERLFACPFSKANPLQHSGCNGYIKISHVKQHLRRSHRRPEYCPRCNDVFMKRSDLDMHLRRTVNLCAVAEELRPAEGIDSEQEASLEKPRPGDPAAQWFCMWDIVFPNRPRPDSPYFESQADLLNRILSSHSDEQAHLFLDQLLTQRRGGNGGPGGGSPQFQLGEPASRKRARIDDGGDTSDSSPRTAEALTPPSFKDDLKSDSSCRPHIDSISFIPQPDIGFAPSPPDVSYTGTSPPSNIMPISQVPVSYPYVPEQAIFSVPSPTSPHPSDGLAQTGSPLSHQGQYHYIPTGQVPNGQWGFGNGVNNNIRNDFTHGTNGNNSNSSNPTNGARNAGNGQVRGTTSHRGRRAAAQPRSVEPEQTNTADFDALFASAAPETFYSSVMVHPQGQGRPSPPIPVQQLGQPQQFMPYSS